MRLSRRQFLGAGAVTGASLLLPWHVRLQRVLTQATPTLDPTSIPKYVTPLVVPPAMPRTATIKAGTIDYYVIAVVQFAQQILPAGLPRTRVWSYQLRNAQGTRNYPAFTIEARAGRPVRVQWINGLVDAAGNYLPHILPIDPTLHWANPPGGVAGRDARPTFAATPGAYTGPVPIVTHLHGGHNREEHDGYPEAWYLPAAANIPAGYATVGSLYEEFKAKSQAATGAVWAPGTAVFEYDNQQPASTLWFHDHTLGVTRANVYAGPAGFYLLRGGANDLPAGVLPGPAPARGDPAGRRYYELPLAIQDRSFDADGSLFYPGSRAFFDGFQGPYIPGSDVPPLWNPEVFGNAMLVNGKTWPFLQVEPRRYRLRLLNGCNGRFLILRLDPALGFWQIGAEGGFLPAPVQLDQLLLGPAERADVIVDFTGRAGQTVRLRNLGPDEPFGGGTPGVDFDPANPATTGQVLEFRVTLPLSGEDTSTPPDELNLGTVAPAKPGATTNTRQVSLNEAASTFGGFDGPVAALLGTMNGTPSPLGWGDPITEHVRVGAVEEWAMHNFTEDAHPIHIHEIQFQVVNRQPFGGEAFGPESWETGLKDTVVAYPGQITRVKAHYDRAGLFVWHCHIVEHEDNEMMRPYRIG